MNHLDRYFKLVNGIVGIIEISGDEVNEMIRNGKITDGFTLAALSLFRS